jgi:peptide/nickel transport system permease protein
MHRYIARRLLIAAPVLVGITVVTFLMLELAPGDPVLAMIGPDQSAASTADLDRLRAQYGLDRPLPIRYWEWLSNVATGEFGRSFVFREPVGEVILRRLPATLQLMGLAYLLGTLSGLTLGLLCAVRKYGRFDNTVAVVGYVWDSTPSFFIGLGALYVFSVQLHLIPVLPTFNADGSLDGGDAIRRLILPVAILGLDVTAPLLRYTRSSLLDVLGQDFLTGARSRGLSEVRVLVGHAFPNALIPIVTIVGFQLPGLIGGSVLIENVFGWPGLGALFVSGVEGRDYPLVMALSLMSTAAVLLTSIVVDLGYAVVDPRIRYS